LRCLSDGIAARVDSRVAGSISVTQMPGPSEHCATPTPHGSTSSTADFFVPPGSYAASAVGFTGRITIDGWYDTLLPPDEDDLYYLREELKDFSDNLITLFFILKKKGSGNKG